jgi:hypothetical protein
MHPLIHEQRVEYIRSTGHALEAQPNRVEIMDSLGLPYDRPAENIILWISGLKRCGTLLFGDGKEL